MVRVLGPGPPLPIIQPILDSHPLYVNPLDAFVGKGFLFLERLRPKTKKWNPDFPFDDLQKEFDRYGVISADDSRLSHNGFQFTLSAADVDTKVTFMCE